MRNLRKILVFWILHGEHYKVHVVAVSLSSTLIKTESKRIHCAVISFRAFAELNQLKTYGWLSAPRALIYLGVFVFVLLRNFTHATTA